MGIPPVKEHLGNVLFKEAGAVTGAFFDQYALANEESEIAVEKSVWIYCHESYLKLRLATMLLRADRNELLAELAKIAEATFLMVVIFASTVAKHRVVHSGKAQGEFKFLKGSSEHVSAGCAFVESVPAYADLIALPGISQLASPLLSRQTCVHAMSMKVAQASHLVFAAFTSSRKDDQDDRVLLKEQLVFYYMQMSLEVWLRELQLDIFLLEVHPYFTVSTALQKKLMSLCSKSMSQDVDMWKNWKGKSEPTKKILELLLRLISLVDIQVLPHLLELLAQLIAQNCQKMAKICA
ncbi:hypothetical protein ACLOJK_033519 [Asimina triloba]